MRKVKRKKRRGKVDSKLIFGLVIIGIFLTLAAGLLILKPKIKPICANSISCIKDLTGKKEAYNKGVFMGKTVYAPLLSEAKPVNEDAPQLPYGAQVLADQAGDYKRIYVDLTNQKLYAFEGKNIVMNVPVSTGKWYPTPTGEFRIWIWLRYTRMSGGSGAGYYDLPNVPFTMYFYNNSISKASGFSLHGAYWHNNFGYPMSHGCVNMKIEDAEKLFYWTYPGAGGVNYPAVGTSGTLVTVYGKTPKS